MSRKLVVSIAIAVTISLAAPVSSFAGGCPPAAAGNIVENYSLELYDGEWYEVQQCEVDIVDLQCSIVTLLWDMNQNVTITPPACLDGLDPSAVDLNCDGSIDVIDVVRIIEDIVRPLYSDKVQWMQNAGWPDADGDLVHDACDPDADGDGFTEDVDPCPMDTWNACPANPCNSTDCDDGNECTWDACWPLTGECTNFQITLNFEVSCGTNATGICDAGICTTD